MKKSSLFLIAAAIGTASVAFPAFAEEKDGKGWYGTAGIGFLSPNNPSGGECTTILTNNVCANYDYTFDTGLSGEIGVGYDFGKFRIETTYTRTNTSLSEVSADVSVNNFKTASVSSRVNDGNTNLNSFMVNGYIDIDTKSKFVPYMGGGIGYSDINFSSYTVKILGVDAKSGSGSSGAFGYQAKAGLSYLASKKVDIFGEAVFTGTTGFALDTVNVDSMTAWGARAGLRYRF
jgi:opacity protein-like surface antigen